ncbi:MAG: hypothetical protein HC920_10500 [Oscillatoriales cyanobacterium SM2_3_0]|nr:hypothetical protein [Oscillatoriales cyanobacterium SM2_3_0]
MQSSPKSFSELESSRPAPNKIASNLMLGMATAPVLCLLTGSQFLGKLLTGLSQSSEDVFRAIASRCCTFLKGVIKQPLLKKNFKLT